MTVRLRQIVQSAPRYLTNFENISFFNMRIFVRNICSNVSPSFYAVLCMNYIFDSVSDVLMQILEKCVFVILFSNMLIVGIDTFSGVTSFSSSSNLCKP